MAVESRESQGPVLEPRWLDVDAAAQYLCMSRHALYHRVSRRQIPFVRHGRIIRFDRQSLDRWMSKGAQGIGGSNPLAPTNRIKDLRPHACGRFHVRS